jgi:hypothetical protein
MKQPHRSVHATWSFLHEQRLVLQPFAQLHLISCKMSSGADGFSVKIGVHVSFKIFRLKDSAFRFFWDAPDNILEGITLLGEAEFDAADDFEKIEAFICLLYRSPFETLGETRWFLFSNKQKQDAALPPTKGAAIHHIRRSHYQTMKWKNATPTLPNLGDPLDYG